MWDPYSFGTNGPPDLWLHLKRCMITCECVRDTWTHPKTEELFLLLSKKAHPMTSQTKYLSESDIHPKFRGIKQLFYSVHSSVGNLDRAQLGVLLVWVGLGYFQLAPSHIWGLIWEGWNHWGPPSKGLSSFKRLAWACSHGDGMAPGPRANAARSRLEICTMSFLIHSAHENKL